MDMLVDPCIIDKQLIKYRLVIMIMFQPVVQFSDGFDVEAMTFDALQHAFHHARKTLN